MGNCLDIPPPPPKLQHASQTKPDYIHNRIPAGPLRSRPGVYSAYQPYPVSSIPPVVAYDPFSGQPYSYPVDKSPLVSGDELVNGEHYIYTADASNLNTPYYKNSSYLSNGSYSNHDNVVTKDARRKKHLIHNERRTHNGEIPDKNSNTLTTNAKVTSTIITTFPDPRDDVIKRGHEIIVSSDTPRSQSATVTSGAIKITPATERLTSGVLERTSSSDRIISETQNIVIQTKMSSAPVATRGSTYITYIEDEPPPQESVVEEMTDIEVEANKIQSEENILLDKEQTEGVYKTSQANGVVVQLFVDEPFNKTPVVKETTSNFVSSDWKKRTSSSYRSPLRQYDLVICHDSADEGIMWKIKNELQAVGFTVAISSASGGNAWDGFLDWTTFSQAVVDAKVMVVLLSPHSVKNKHLKDQVSLAHITETSVCPVAVGRPVDILSGMDIALKLQLASYTWTELAEGNNPDIAFLVNSVKEELHAIQNYEIIDDDFGEVSSWAQKRRRVIHQRQTRLGGHVTAVQYWDKFYTNRVHSIVWDRFYKDLRREYREIWNSTVPKPCTPHLMGSLKRELAVASDGLVHKVHFVEFCSEVGKDQDVWERIRTVARDTQAIRDVFDVESTVRMVAVENIGKFGSPGVFQALRELLTDQDANIRAVAIISLSRYALKGDRVTLTSLMTTLDDKDKFVRETACLAMGYLKAQEAVDKLTFIWRNDDIKEVRAAAGTALREIGVKDVIRVSRVLSDTDVQL